MILFTNLSKKEFNIYEITGFYTDKWKIEDNYDKLKNKMEIENYTGNGQITINKIFIQIFIYSTFQ